MTDAERTSEGADAARAPRGPFAGWRAWLIGGLASLLLALASPYEGTSFALINIVLPPFLLVVLMLLAVVVNPLLGRARLRPRELGVIAIMILGSAAVSGVGLARQWSNLVVGTSSVAARSARVDVLTREPTAEEQVRREERAAELAALEAALWNRGDDPEWLQRRIAHHRRDYAGPVSLLPEALVPGIDSLGRLDLSDAQYQRVVDVYRLGFDDREADSVIHGATVTLEGTGPREALADDRRDLALLTGQDIVDLDPAAPTGDLVGLAPGESTGGFTVEAARTDAIEWAAWRRLGWVWLPLVLGSLVAMVGLAGVVHRQWRENERIPYPLVQIAAPLIADPGAHGRLPPVLRTTAFRVAFLVTAGVVAWKGLYRYGLVPIDIKTQWDLISVFGWDPWGNMPKAHRVLRPMLWPSMLAVAFLMGTGISFSIWSGFLGANLICLLLVINGVPVTGDHLSDASLGAFIVMAILIVYLGRHAYWAAAKAAVGIASGPEARVAGNFLRLVVAGSVVVAAGLVWHGVPVAAAVLGIVVLLGIMLVAARIVAEAGIPFIGLPWGVQTGPLMVAAGGWAGAATSLIPLAMLGAVVGNIREAAAPLAVNANGIADHGGVGQRSRAGWFLGAAALGAVVACAATVLYAGLGDGSWRDAASRAGSGTVINPVLALHDGTSGIHHLALVVGVVIAAGLGLARTRWAWWPLHPVGLMLCNTTAVDRTWFSYLLGWLACVLVLRYGGTRLYTSLKPAAIGIVVADGAVQVVFLIVKFIVDATGGNGQFLLTLP